MDFQTCVQIILEHEGDYSSDPNDPGGETKFGISKRSYPNLNIPSLTKEDATTIYKRDFWDIMQLDLFPEAFRLLIFDCSVNQGVGFSKMALYKITNTDNMKDAIFLINKLNPNRFFVNFATERSVRYCQSMSFSKYGRGWFKRLNDVLFRSVT